MSGPREPRFDERDVVLGAGLLLLSVGSGWVFLPLGLIVPGAVLTVLAVVWARPPHRGRER